MARNYLPFARTLMASFAAADPAVDRFVFVVDAVEAVPEMRDATVLVPSDVFDYEEYAGLAYSFDITELSTCVKPFVLRHLLERGYDRAFYFDPDIEVFGPIDVVRDPLDAADIVLTPHTTEPIPLDGKLPDEITLLRAGSYNLGFIGVANRAPARGFLDWWAARLERYCVNDVVSGLFTDQKWIDLVPGLVERVAIVRHRGCNVAYWNLHSRRIDPTVPLQLASGEPIVFFHYSGFNPRTPEILSKHQTRIDLAGEPGLAKLLSEYAGRVMANGFSDASRTAYAFSRFSNGVATDTFSRSVLREARIGGHRFPDPADVFAEPSAWRFLNEPVDEDATAIPQPLTRYLYELWKKRPDLRATFPQVLSGDRERFVNWLRNDSTTGVDRAYLAEAGLRVRPQRLGPSFEGVNVAGYFKTESGVGEAGRGHVAALRAAGIPTRLVDFSAHSPSRAADTSIAGREGDGVYPINLVCVNADQVATFLAKNGDGFFRGKYNIGSWWWELPEFPDAWLDAFEPFDEIWVGTQYIAAAIAPKSPVPVVIVPPVVSVGAVRLGRKADFGLDPDDTVFLFVYDYLSVFGRKNPLGAIEAFRRAFPDRRARVRLVMKSINSEFDLAAYESVRDAAAEDDRIVLIDGYFSRRQKNELLGACDAYLSLHRAEGFGYTLAEAMTLGKPVIATAFSGSADLVTGSNAFPIKYELVPVGPGNGPYAADQMWAEPDLDHAAAALRRVYERPTDARRLGERARSDVLGKYGTAAVARIAGERIERILGRLPERISV